MSFTCAVTGEESDGKHYIVRSTEGEEVISPEALLGGGKTGRSEPSVKSLAERVERLEELLGEKENEGRKEAEEEKKAAAPAKKAAAKKAAVPHQRAE